VADFLRVKRSTDEPRRSPCGVDNKVVEEARIGEPNADARQRAEIYRPSSTATSISYTWCWAAAVMLRRPGHPGGVRLTHRVAGAILPRFTTRLYREIGASSRHSEARWAGLVARIFGIRVSSRERSLVTCPTRRPSRTKSARAGDTRRRSTRAVDGNPPVLLVFPPGPWGNFGGRPVRDRGRRETFAETANKRKAKEDAIERDWDQPPRGHHRAFARAIDRQFTICVLPDYPSSDAQAVATARDHRNCHRKSQTNPHRAEAVVLFVFRIHERARSRRSDIKRSGQLRAGIKVRLVR